MLEVIFPPVFLYVFHAYKPRIRLLYMLGKVFQKV